MNTLTIKIISYLLSNDSTKKSYAQFRGEYVSYQCNKAFRLRGGIGEDFEHKMGALFDKRFYECQEKLKSDS